MIVINRTAFLNKMNETELLKGQAFTSEDGGHQFVITCRRDGEDVALSGTVTGRFMRADGVSVQLTPSYAGITEDGKAWVILPANCYTVRGQFALVIFYTDGDGHKCCIYSAAGYVRDGVSEQIVDPENVIDVDAIQAMIGDLQDAIEDAQEQATSSVQFTAQSLTDAQKAQARGNIGAGSEADVSDLKSAIDENNSRLGYEEITITGTTGKYVNANGGLSNGGSFAYTAVGIPVEAGDTVVFSGRGYSTTVAMIYTCDEDGSNRSPVVMSIDASKHDYSYTFYHDGFVGFSWHTGIAPSVWKTNHELAASAYSMLQSDNINVPFQMGNINVSGGNATWVASDTRVRSAKSLYLRVGDIIGLTDYTDARYLWVYTNDGTTYTASAWLTKNYTATKEGSYYVVIGNLTDINQGGVISNLADLFFGNRSFSVDQIIKYTDDEIKANSINGLGHPMFANVKNPIISHRGLSNVAPENSIPAFELAGKANVWGIETDIFELSDGTFVCFHDATVARMTDGTGNIADMTWEQVSALTIDAGSNIEQYPNLKIPKLEDYLNVCKLYGCIAVLDIHYIRSAVHYSNLANIIKKCGMESKCVVAVGDSIYNALHKVSIPSTPLVFTIFSTNNITNKLKNAEYFKCGILIENTVLTSEICEQVHSWNAPVLTFVTDSKAEAISYIATGTDIVESNALTTLRD